MPGVRNQLIEIRVGDDSAAWANAGFSIVADETVIGGVRVLLDGSDGERHVKSLAIEGLGGGELDGLALHTARPAPMTLEHPNGITEIDHLVVMTPDCDRTTSALEAAGIEARRVRRFGAPGEERRQTFFWLGDVILELVGPDAPSGDGPATAWGLALTAPDLDATAAAIADRITPPKAAVQPGRRIATIKTRDLDISTALAVMSPHARPA